MKILFFMAHAGATRNFESTLRGLADHGHEVHMAFARMEKKNLPGLFELADALVLEHATITSGAHPYPAKDEYSRVASRLRASIDFMRYSNPEYADAPKLRRRAERWAPERVRKRFDRSSGAGRRMMRRAFQAAERSGPVSERVLGYLRDQAPDVVLVTPLLEPGSVQTEYLRAANRLGIPTCLCVSSWDNLTNKGLIHEMPDAVTVWNEMQRDEAIRFHAVPEERVVVTGSAAYDHWFGWEPSRSREEFATAVGLDPSRPFVAYVGSSGFITPDESGFIVEWVERLRGEGLENLQVLVRPHPVNPLLGKDASQIALARLENVHVYPPAGANPTDVQSRQDYFDSMYYAGAVAGVNTTAFLEAAILGRPVFTVLTARYEETQTGQLHFHHLLNAGGGLLHVAPTYEEHAAQLRAALETDAAGRTSDPRSLAFTEVFIRPNGVDQPATPRMVEAIEGLPERRTAQGRAGRRSSFTGRFLARIARRAAERNHRRAQKAKRAKDRRLRAEREKKRVAQAEKAQRLGQAGAAAGAAKGKKRPKGERPPKRAKGDELPQGERPPKRAKGEKPPQGERPPKRAKGEKLPKSKRPPKRAKGKKVKGERAPKRPKGTKLPKAAEGAARRAGTVPSGAASSNGGAAAETGRPSTVTE